MVWSWAKRAARRLRRQPFDPHSIPVSTASLDEFFDWEFPQDGRELAKLLAKELPRWVKGVWTIRDPAYEEQLFAHLPQLLERLDTEAWSVNAAAWLRLACHHIQAGNTSAFHHFLLNGGLDSKRHGGSLDAGRPVVHLPGWEDPNLDRELFVLSPTETSFVGKIRRARWVDEQLELVVTAGMALLEVPGETAVARAWWQGTELDVALTHEKFGHREAAWNETLDGCHWLIRIPCGLLSAATEGDFLRMNVALAGRQVDGEVRSIDTESSAALLPAREIGALWWGIDATGRLAPVDGEPRKTGPLLSAWRIEPESIVVEGSGRAAFAELVSPKGRIPASWIEADQHSFVAHFPSSYDPWGLGEAALPISDYHLEIDGQLIGAHAELVGSTPRDLGAGKLVGHTMVSRGTVGLRLVKPRRPLENTMYGQRALRRQYQELDERFDENVALFQCFWAEVATDSQVPIFEEMKRRMPDLQAYWGVLDHSVRVPEGAIPVVAGSWEWYEVLAKAAWIVKNTEVGEYTVLRPGQCYLQTFHGQPFKSMGATFWRDTKQWPEFRVRWESATRRSDFWSLILTPDSDADHWYRENYFYEGEILSLGLPRTDSLLSSDAQEHRLAARSRLGIEPEQVAVLHATTWREDRSAGNNTAQDLDFLDVAALAEDLGDDYVILQRSHHAVARSQQQRLDAAGVLNVTDYPEINDLILASDVAILDYSSLRFEVALAQVPMVFFVPDLDEYEGRLRGFLFDFEESAPGPILRESSRIADLVRNPHALRQEFGGEIESFNRRFNAQHDGHAAERVVDAMVAWRQR